MRTLGDLIERFSRSLNSDIFIKESIQGAIQDVVGIEIKTDNLSVKDGLLNIQTSPVVKNEIHLKERLILNNLKGKKILIERITYS